ncbi:hypothetical protein F4802DRAFT_559446, partial [Xylaria palmicola]
MFRVSVSLFFFFGWFLFFFSFFFSSFFFPNRTERGIENGILLENSVALFSLIRCSYSPPPPVFALSCVPWRTPMPACYVTYTGSCEYPFSSSVSSTPPRPSPSYRSFPFLDRPQCTRSTQPHLIILIHRYVASVEVAISYRCTSGRLYASVHLAYKGTSNLQIVGIC